MENKNKAYNDVADYILEKGYDQYGNVTKLTGSMSRELKTIFDTGDIKVEDKNDFKARFHEAMSVIEKSKKDKMLITGVVEEWIEDYGTVVDESVTKANGKITKRMEDISSEMEKLQVQHKELESKINTNTRLKDTFGSSAPESSETLSDTIDAAYLDELAQTQGLHPKHVEQLANMKKLLANNPNCTIKKDRLTTRDGKLFIDGYDVPSDFVDHSNKPAYKGKNKGFQNYDDMNVVGSEFLYAEGVLRLLNFTAEMGGKKFDQGTLNSTNLRDKSLDKDEISKQLRAEENISILGDLSRILNLQGYFPIGIDKEGFVIYADVRSDSIRFVYGYYRLGNYNCLSSSNGDKTPLSGGVSQ